MQQSSVSGKQIWNPATEIPPSSEMSTSSEGTFVKSNFSAGLSDRLKSLGTFRDRH